MDYWVIDLKLHWQLDRKWNMYFNKPPPPNYIFYLIVFVVGFFFLGGGVFLSNLFDHIPVYAYSSKQKVMPAHKPYVKFTYNL